MVWRNDSGVNVWQCDGCKAETRADRDYQPSQFVAVLRRAGWSSKLVSGGKRSRYAGAFQWQHSRKWEHLCPKCAETTADIDS